jgi:hypothetical protein
LPDGYRVPPHTHPKTERVTVISGTFNIGMGDKFDEKATKAMETVRRPKLLAPESLDAQYFSDVALQLQVMAKARKPTQKCAVIQCRNE